MQQVLHRDEDSRIICRRSENKVAAAERVGEDVACGGDGGVIHAHLHAALDKFCGEDICGVLGVAVHGGIGQHHAVLLRCVAAPLEVLIEERTKIAPPDEAVQRADIIQRQPRCLLQHSLHLHAVLADDVCIIPARLIDIFGEEIGLVREQAAVERAEGSERVRREEYAVGGIIAHHDLRPVHHRSHDEAYLMPPQLQHVALLDDVQPVGEIDAAEEILQHRLDLAVAYELQLRISEQQRLDGVRVVRLHMGDDEVVRPAPAERVGDILKIGLIDGLINGVENGRFFVEHDIGIIAYAVGNAVHALEACKAAVVRADPDKIIGYLSSAVHMLFLRVFLFDIL